MLLERIDSPVYEVSRAAGSKIVVLIWMILRSRCSCFVFDSAFLSSKFLTCFPDAFHAGFPTTVGDVRPRGSAEFSPSDSFWGAP